MQLGLLGTVQPLHTTRQRLGISSTQGGVAGLLVWDGYPAKSFLVEAAGFLATKAKFP